MHTSQDVFFIEISPFAKKVTFITEFAILYEYPLFYEVKEIFRKKFFSKEGISKHFF